MGSVTTDRRQGVNSGRAIKVACAAATTGNIVLSGEQTIDAGACVSGDRVLVKDQIVTTQNGVYVCDTGNWVRDLDFDGTLDIGQGTLVPVNGGTLNGYTLWRLTSTGTLIPGTSALIFEKALFSDSDTLRFIRAEAGAVARSVRDKLRESMTRADFISDATYLAAETLAGLNQFALSSGGQAGNTTLTGLANTGLGHIALASVTTGQQNTGVGQEALTNLTTARLNTGIGAGALQRCLSGDSNTGVGAGACFANTTGFSNTGLGYNALNGNETGSSNTLVGTISGLNLKGSGNTGVGVECLTGNVARNWATDGTFDVPGLPAWVLGAGWADGTGKAAKNSNGVGTLTRVGDDAPAAVMVGLDFEVTYTVKDMTVGEVTVSVGGFSDTPRNVNGTFTFSGTAITTAGLTFTPSGGSANASRFSIDDVEMFMTTPVTASQNVAYGNGAMWYQVLGTYNVAIGRAALHMNSIGSRNIALGPFAGYYEVGSDRFIVNNRDRLSAANDAALSLLYGVMADAIADQTLVVNAHLGVNRTPTTTLDVYDSGVSVTALLESDLTTGLARLIAKNNADKQFLFVQNGATAAGTTAAVSNANLAFAGSTDDNGAVMLGSVGAASSVYLAAAAGVQAILDTTGVSIGVAADVAARSATQPTKALTLYNGTAPVGTLVNGCTLYVTAGEMRVMDAAGNATLLSPHDHETNEWIYDSVETTTGRRLRIDVERLLKALNDANGWDYVHDTAQAA